MKHFRLFAAVMALSYLGTQVAHGQFNWTGNTSTNWNIGSNWDTGATPNSTSIVVIDSNAANQPALTNGNISVANLTIGQAIQGNLTIANGASLTTGHGFVSPQTGVTSTIIITGAGSTWLNALAGGLGSTLTLGGNGGTVNLTIANSGNLSMGGSMSIVGAGGVLVTDPGSSLQTPGVLRVGDGGTGSLTIANGASLTTANTNIGIIVNGSNSTLEGRVIVDGANSTWNSTNAISIGMTSNGSLTIVNGGRVTGNFAIDVGYGNTDANPNPGATHGKLVVDGHSTLVGHLNNIGAGGQAIVNITNGGRVTDHGSITFVGASLGGHGDILVDGANSAWLSDGSIYLGYNGTGNLTVANGGTVTFANSINVGFLFGTGAGQLTVTGAGSFVQATDVTSRNGSSITVADGGLLKVQGILDMSNTTLSLANGGTLQIGGSTSLPASNNAFYLNFSGGNLQVVGSDLSTLRGGNLSTATSNTIDTNGFNATWAGAFFGNGSLVKNGNGTLILNGNNSYTGNTTINQGTLRIAINTTPYSGNFINHASLALNLTNDASLQGIISGEGSLTKSGPFTLTLSGNNTYTGNTIVTGGVLTLTGDTANLGGNIINNGSLVFSQDFDSTFSGIISGNGDFHKLGAGTLTLNGNSTFSGDVLLDNGNVQLGSSTALGAGNIVLNGGGVQWSSGFTADISNPISLGSTNNTLDTNGANVTLSSAMDGGGGLIKAGAGTLTLLATQAYTGDTVISTGTLALGNGNVNGSVVTNITNNADLVFNEAGDFTFTDVISGTGNLAQATAANLTLTATNTFSGNTTIINNGTIILGNASALGNSTLSYVTNGGFIVVGNLTSVALGGLTGNKDFPLLNQSSQSLNLTVGANNQSTTYDGKFSGPGSLTKTGTGTLLLNGNNTYAGGTLVTNGNLVLGQPNALGNTTGNITVSRGTLDLNSQPTITANIVTVGNSTTSGGIVTNGSLSASAYVVQNGTVNATLGGPATLTKNTSGNLTLNAANTYSGGTVFTTGTFRLGNPAAVGTGTFTISGGAFDNSSGAAMTLANNNAIVFSAAPNITFTGTSDLNLGTGNVTVVGNQNVRVMAGNLSIGGDMSGTGNLTKSNGGVFNINGPTSFSGNVLITGGTLRLNDPNALQYAKMVYNNPGGSLSFGNLTSVVLGSLTGNRDKSMTNLSDAAVDLAVGNNNSSGTYSGNFVTAGGNFTKLGTGTLTLSGNNVYTGATILNGGTLEFANLSNLGAGTAITFNGGVLQWAANSTTDVSTRTVTLGPGNATLNTNGNNVTLANPIGNNGTGGLTKAGNGVLTLGAANTYTGNTTVTGGTLVLTPSSILPDNTTIILAGGTLDVSAIAGYAVGANQTLSGQGSTNGSVTINGTLTPVGGLLAFNQDVTLSPNATLNLQIGGSARGTQYAAINVAGNLVMGGRVVLNFAGGFAPPPGSSFQFFQTTGSTTGTFANVTLPNLNSNLTWDVSHLTTNGTITASPINYSQWTGVVGLSGNNALPQAQAFSGPANLIRYALNLDLANEPAGLPSTTTYSASGTNYLAIRYRYRKGLNDAQIVPQTSPDLVSWTDIPAENITQLADADLYTAQYQASVARPTNSSIFLRVLVRPTP